MLKKLILGAAALAVAGSMPVSTASAEDTLYVPSLS